MGIHSPDYLEQRDSYPFIAIEGALVGSPKEQPPSLVVIGVLGALEPQKQVTKSKLGDDREGSNNVLINIAESWGQEYNEKNNQFEWTPRSASMWWLSLRRSKQRAQF